MTDITDRQRPNRPAGGRGKRLGWFVLLWTAGVASVGLVSLVLRAWIGS